MTALNFTLAVFCFWCVVVQNIASSEHEAILSSLLHSQPANVGEDVTLPCSCQNPTAFEYYWFKQGFGQSPQFVAKCFSLVGEGTFSEEFNNPRFSLDIKQSNCQLKISNMNMFDSATYYCITGSKHPYQFCEGTTLSVKGSSFSVSLLVHKSETIQPEEPETLSCTIENLTCSGKHSVYWFRESEGSQPGLIYTQQGSNDQCLQEPKTQTPTCVYNLPVEHWNLSYNGTYYCAVATCGHIFFGERKRHTEKCGDSVLVYFLGAALVLAMIAVACLIFLLCKRNFDSVESQAGCSASFAENTTGHQGADNIHYAVVHPRKARGSRKQKTAVNSECVYSDIHL